MPQQKTIPRTDIQIIALTVLPLNIDVYKRQALAYYNAGGYVYYITLGDLEGVHRMLFDGSEDIILQNLDGMEIGANTKVSITYNGCLLYTSRCV